MGALLGKQAASSCPSLGSVPDSGEKSFVSPGPAQCSAASQEAIERYSGLLMTLFWITRSIYSPTMKDEFRILLVREAFVISCDIVLGENSQVSSIKDFFDFS